MRTTASDSDRRGEGGVALATAIYAIVILGALMSAAFFIGLQDQFAGRNTVQTRVALGAAEAGAEQIITDWNSSYNLLPIGDSITFQGWLADSSGWYRGSLRRMNKLIHMIRSEGFSSDSSARFELGYISKIFITELEVRSALETQGELTITGGTEVSGIDTIPPGLTDCPPLEDAPGVTIENDDDLTLHGAYEIRGDPPILEDSEIDDESLTTFGDELFSELADAADITLAPGTYKVEPRAAGGVCDTSDPTNWGEPGSVGPPGTNIDECEDHFPVVYVDGDLSINQVRGQGLLIVNGRLNMQGKFRYYGAIIVRETIETQGTGAHVFGGVIAANVNNSDNDVAGNAEIYYSSCALLDALTVIGPGSPLRERAWSRLF